MKKLAAYPYSKIPRNDVFPSLDWIGTPLLPGPIDLKMETRISDNIRITKLMRWGHVLAAIAHPTLGAFPCPSQPQPQRIGL